MRSPAVHLSVAPQVVGLGFALLLSFAFATRGAAQTSSWRPVTIPSCPSAESALGPPTGEPGLVQQIFDQRNDSLFLLAGTNAGRSGITEISAQLTLKHGDATDSPTVQFMAFLRGNDAETLISLKEEAPTLSITVDDSILISLGALSRQQFSGGSRPGTVPLAIRLRPGPFLEVARGAKVELRIGDFLYTLTDRQRRNLAGLYRVAVCGVPVGPAPRSGGRTRRAAG